MRTRFRYGSDDGHYSDEFFYAIGAMALWTTLVVTAFSVTV